jgi:hypothetical protein
MRGFKRLKGRKPTMPFLVRFRQTTSGMPGKMCDAPSMREFLSWQARTPASPECSLVYRARWSWFFSWMPA